MTKVMQAVPLMTDDRQWIAKRPPMEHKVKSWTMLFQAALAGDKRHDLRVLDRDYQVNDTLLLQEYNWGEQRYTGRELRVLITYITRASYPKRREAPNDRECAFSPTCLHPDYGVFSIEKCEVQP